MSAPQKLERSGSIDSMGPKPTCWKKHGEYMVISALIITTLSAIAIGSVLLSDHIFKNAGTDVMISAGCVLGIMAVVLVSIHFWNKSKKEKAAKNSDAVGKADSTKADPVKQESKCKKYALNTIKAIGALLGLAVLVGVGYYVIGWAAIGHDHFQHLSDAWKAVKEAFGNFYDHTFQPLDEILGKAFSDFGAMAKGYFSEHWMGVAAGAAYAGVALPMIVYSGAKIYSFLFGHKDHDQEETNTRGSRANSTDSTDSTESDPGDDQAAVAPAPVENYEPPRFRRLSADYDAPWAEILMSNPLEKMGGPAIAVSGFGSVSEDTTLLNIPPVIADNSAPEDDVRGMRGKTREKSPSLDLTDKGPKASTVGNDRPMVNRDMLRNLDLLTPSSEQVPAVNSKKDVKDAV